MTLPGNGRPRSRPTPPAVGLVGVGLLSLILVGFAAGRVLRSAGVTGLVDRPVESFVVGHREGWLTAAMRPLTDLGGAAVLVPLVVAAGLGWWWRRGSWRPLALLAGAIAGAWVVQVAVKQLVERPRPPVGLALSHARGFAFPSGHATDAAAVYGMLAVLAFRAGRRAVRLAAVTGAGGLVALIGLSLLYLGVHWLTDVLAGVGLGGVWIATLLLAVGTGIQSPARPGPTRHRRLGWVLVAAVVAASLLVPELAEGIRQPGRATVKAPVATASVAAAPRRPPQPHAVARAAAARPPAGASHVVLVVEENHEFAQVIGSAQAPFLNRLAARGTLLTRYDAVGHPSLPNYVALVAGDPLGIYRDCRACHRPGRTLVDQLQAAGISWQAYYQGLPAPCSPAARVGDYTKNMNPFLHLDRVRSSPSSCRRVVPLTQLGTDLAGGRFPRLAMVTPDLVHDMHSGPIRRADALLRRLDRQFVASPADRGGVLLIVTFDEGTSDRGLHRRPGGGHVAAIVVGPGVRSGGRDPTPYDHYALLRSLERRFGLRPLRHAADPRTRTIPAIAGPAPAHAPRSSR